MSPDVDVAVVGGGPAGCAAALTLRRLGHSVAVISAGESAEKPTETAAPHLAHLLRVLGADGALDSCEPCFEIESSWIAPTSSSRPSFLNAYGPPWFVHRRRFDRALKASAERAGARWIEGRARDVDMRGPILRVRIGHEAIQARWLIAACGSSPWAANVTGQKAVVVDRLIALWSRLPTRMDEGILTVQCTDYGWWYLCPGEGDTTIACLVTDSTCEKGLQASKPKLWNGLFETTAIARRLGTHRDCGTVQSAPFAIRFLTKVTGPSWCIAGDSAMQLDPIGSSGTITAIDSAMRAARAASEAMQGDRSSLNHYGTWCHSLFQAFVRERGNRYANQSRRWPRGFWSRRTELQDAEESRSKAPRFTGAG